MRVAVTGFGTSYSTAHLDEAALRECRPVLPTFSGDWLEEVERETAGIAESLARGELDRDEIGVVFGSSKGDLRQLESAEGLPEWWSWPDRFAAQLAHRLGAGGPVMAPVAACATGAHCIALGAQAIADGKVRVVVAGAYENSLLAPVLACYRNMGALSKSGVVRPFDAARDGFLPGEGLGFVVLEEEGSALRRGAHIWGLVSGWSLKCDVHHMTAMDPSGASIARAIQDALRCSGLQSVDYVNAHGTATRLNDLAESRAIEAVLGSRVPVSSTKPLTRHLLGAAGAVESVICLQAMAANWLPPTLNLENADAGCNLDYIPLNGRSRQVQNCLNLNYGFGGHIGALIFEKYRTT